MEMITNYCNALELIYSDIKETQPVSFYSIMSEKLNKMRNLAESLQYLKMECDGNIEATAALEKFLEGTLSEFADDFAIGKYIGKCRCCGCMTTQPSTDTGTTEEEVSEEGSESNGLD